MIVIDGKEGGGQVLRVALGLSAVTRKSVKVVNIRGARSGGIGLKSQHLEGLLAIGQLCGAEIKGGKLGSTEVEFIPGKIEGKDLDIHLPTAGSIGLLFQSLQLPCAFANGDVRVHVVGGSTASAWSPTLHYMQNVFLPTVKRLGYNGEIRIVRHGFYPKGGAEVHITVHPVEKLTPAQLTERGKVKSIGGVSVAGSLPSHVAERQTRSATRFLRDHGFCDVNIATESVDSVSPGTSITLWAQCENTILGSDVVGEKGVPAEEVGEKAASELVESVESKSALDKNMADQLLVFLALAKGRSEVTIERFTGHVETNTRIIEQILGVAFEVKREERRIDVEGVGSP